MANSGWSAYNKGGWGVRFYVDTSVSSRSGTAVTFKVTAYYETYNAWLYSDERYVNVTIGGNYHRFSWSNTEAGSGSQSWSVTLYPGYDADYYTTFCDGGVSGSSSVVGSVDISDFRTYFDATWTTPAAPAITGYSSSNGTSESLSYRTNSTAQALVTQTNVDIAVITGDTGSPGWNGMQISANPWTNTVNANGNVSARRIATYSKTGVWQLSKTVSLLTAPSAPSGLSIKANTTFGATLSWKNTQSMTDYYTYVYDGSVSVGSNGKLNVGSAKLLARLEPGVSSYSNANIWSTTGGYSTKTFSVVQVSSYAAWKRSDKASYATYSYLDGFASSVLKASLSNGAVAPDAPYSVSLSSVADTSFTVKFSAYAPTASKPRTGFRIYAAGQLVKTVESSSGALNGATYTANWPSSIKGKTGSVYVQAYGTGGTANSASVTGYGSLYAPATPTGSRSGTSLTASAANSPSNTYSSAVRLEYSTDNASWVSFNGTLTTQYRTYYVRARVYSSASGLYSPYSATLALASPPMGFNWFRARQDNNYGDDEQTKLVLSFSAIIDIAPVKFVITNNVNSRSFEVAYVANQTDYTLAVDWFEIELTTFTVTAYNAWASVPARVEYQYQPPHVKPPVLLTVQRSPEDSSKAILAFNPASEGAPWTDDGTYYKYRIYVNGAAATEWRKGKASYGTVVFMETALSSKENAFRIGAIDKQGTISELSNTVYYSYKAVDTGVYLYDCDGFTVEDCIITGKNALRLEQSSATIMNSEIIYSKQPYIMSDGSSYKEIGCEVHGNQ